MHNIFNFSSSSVLREGTNYCAWYRGPKQLYYSRYTPWSVYAVYAISAEYAAVLQRADISLVSRWSQMAQCLSVPGDSFHHFTGLLVHNIKPLFSLCALSKLVGYDNYPWIWIKHSGVKAWIRIKLFSTFDLYYIQEMASASPCGTSKTLWHYFYPTTPVIP